MCLSRLVSRGHLGRCWRVAASRAVSSCKRSSTEPAAAVPKGTLAGVWIDGHDKFILTDWAKDLDKQSKGRISAYIKMLSSEMKLGKAFVVNDVLPEKYSAVAITCLGPAKAGFNAAEALDEARENVRIGVGVATLVLRQNGLFDENVYLDECKIPDAAAEGKHLAELQERSIDLKSKALADAAENKGKADPAWKGWDRAAAQNWSRGMCGLPINYITPAKFAQAAKTGLGDSKGVQCRIQSRDWMVKQGMSAAVAVADGSCEPPVFVECIYTGDDPKKPPILLSVQGITFDSGGLCLLPPECMIERRATGLTGAANAIATIWVLADYHAKVNVACVIPLCENMLSGHSIRVGDAFKMINGTEVQVERTDLVGHLMLADALAYGCKTYKPSLVVNMASLTQSVMEGLGSGAFGCFTDSDKVWALMQKAGAHTGDRPYRLPLWDYYKRQLTYQLNGRMRNTGPDKSTTCLGAAFLKTFVPGDFVHMDITGVGQMEPITDAMPYLSRLFMTGRPTRTLVKFLMDYGKKSSDETPRSLALDEPCPPKESWFARAKAGLGLEGSASQTTKKCPSCGKILTSDAVESRSGQKPKCPCCGKILTHETSNILSGSSGSSLGQAVEEDPLCGIIPDDKDQSTKEDPLCGIIKDNDPLFGNDSADDATKKLSGQPPQKCPSCGKILAGITVDSRSGQKPKCPCCGKILTQETSKILSGSSGSSLGQAAGDDPLCGIIPDDKDQSTEEDPLCGIIKDNDPLFGNASADDVTKKLSGQSPQKCPSCGEILAHTSRILGYKCPSCGKLLTDDAPGSVSGQPKKGPLCP